MNIDSINNGFVIDHIKAGKSMEIYEYLRLNELECSVAIIKNVRSAKMGKKDIIKIDANIDIDLDALGFIDSDITVNVIKNGKLTQKRHLELPKEVINILKCKNPRCITSAEQELKHVFVLTNNEQKTYRCKYCEAIAEN